MKKICFFTGTRAEYGILSPLIQRAHRDRSFNVQMLVSGTHLSSQHGYTCNEIKSSGLNIDATVDLKIKGDSPEDICQSMARGLNGFGLALKNLSPHLLIILGDRYEAMAAACAATILQIPIGHLHGGELTYGATDDAFRHSITKMSHLHFVATKEHRHRVIQLGENPEYVFHVGALGVENIRTLHLIDQNTLENELNLPLSSPLILATYHPVTREFGTAETHINCFLNALDMFPKVNVVLTKANADTEGNIINRHLAAYATQNPNRVRLFASLGQLRYLSTMKFAAVVAGNSSSGIIEAPSFGVPTVNIGNRQAGRTRGASVIDCNSDTQSIVNALNHALTPQFRKSAQQATNPYEKRSTSKQILAAIKSCTPPPCKHFFERG